MSREYVKDLGPREDARSSTKSFSLYPKDNDVLEYLRQATGCGTSEVIRTAIHIYAAQMLQIEKRIA